MDWAALEVELGQVLRPGEVITAGGREHWVHRVLVFREEHRVHGALALGIDSVLYLPPRRADAPLPVLWALGPPERVALPSPPGTLEVAGRLLHREARVPAQVDGAGAPWPGAAADDGPAGTGVLARYRGLGAAVALWWGQGGAGRLWPGEEHAGGPERWGLVSPA